MAYLPAADVFASEETGLNNGYSYHFDSGDFMDFYDGANIRSMKRDVHGAMITKLECLKRL